MNQYNLPWKLKFSHGLDKGGRDYMEDFCYSHIEHKNENALFGIFGIFDGHGGPEASKYAHETLKNELLKIDKFWSNDHLEVLDSIKLVYSKIQNMMWIERENWVRTISGYKSTAGTTATILIIRNGIIYTGHVGDSGILLLYSDESNALQSIELTKDHKPDNPVEKKRIEDSGGCFYRKAGIDRVVWNRKNLINGEIDKIPFLAVARSLGDLWSYDSKTGHYHVSPEPDVNHINLDSNIHRGIIMASDGVWNVINKEMCVKLITLFSYLNRNGNIYNVSQVIVNYCLYQWKKRNIKADNISVIVIMLEPQSVNEVSNIFENKKITEDLIYLHNELIENNLISNYNQNESAVFLDNIADFSLLNTNTIETKSSYDEDIELLQQYLLTDAQLSRFCQNWTNFNFYSQIFITALRNMGYTTIPSIATHLCSISSINLEQLMLSFPWSISCMEIINSFPFSNKIKMFIQNQPLLSDFWMSFYTNVTKNIRLMDGLVSNYESDDTMKNILISKSADIADWITSLTNPEFSIMNGWNSSIDNFSDNHCKYALKKSNTSIDNFFAKTTTSIDKECLSETILKSLQLKRSASFDFLKSQLYFDIKSDVNINSGSTTPSLVLSDCDNDICTNIPSTTDDRQLPERPNVPYSLKRKLSSKVAQLIFIPCNESEEQNDKVIQPFSLTHKKRIIM